MYSFEHTYTHTVSVLYSTMHRIAYIIFSVGLSIIITANLYNINRIVDIAMAMHTYMTVVNSSQQSLLKEGKLAGN